MRVQLGKKDRQIILRPELATSGAVWVTWLDGVTVDHIGVVSPLCSGNLPDAVRCASGGTMHSAANAPKRLARSLGFARSIARRPGPQRVFHNDVAGLVSLQDYSSANV